MPCPCERLSDHRYTRPVHSISVVVPVYRGELTLASTLPEILALASESRTAGGALFRVTEVILVHDCGPDDSETVIRSLAEESPIVRAVWLSKNFGQHAATLAGMAQSTGDWVVTLDEDGQYDPADISAMLDVALSTRSDVVYGRALNPAPHGVLRNSASNLAKSLAVGLTGSKNAATFSSYRLMLGTVARTVATYVGPGVYLDVALGWVAGRYATSGITLRGEQRKSGYSYRSLASHFWRLVISSGTRLLRIVSAVGIVLAFLGLLAAIWIVVMKLVFGIDSEGWASLAVILLVGFGSVLLTLGIIAEYLGANVNMAMGKPPFVISDDPATGPLGVKKQS